MANTKASGDMSAFHGRPGEDTARPYRGSEGFASDDSRPLECAELLGQDRRADARDITLKINEALRSQEQFSDNDEGPSIPDQVERVRSRATVVVGAVGPSRCHILNLLLD